MKKLIVKHEEGGKLHKMTHFSENKVKFTGKGGMAKSAALNRMKEVRNRISKAKKY